MDRWSSTKLYELIRSLGIIKHKSRQEFLCSLIMGLIKSRSVHFCEIADKMEKSIKLSSVERRIQDFFQRVGFDYSQLMLFFLSFIHKDRLWLCIDRTEWDFGKTQINILCVAVSIGKMAVPIYFELLDNKSGNSNYEDRIKLFKQIIQQIGKERIELLTMDREFIGHKWLRWLKKQDIAFCVRVPKHHKITLLDGTKHKAEALLASRKTYYYEMAIVDLVVVNLALGYGKKGELLFLIGTLPARQLPSIYRKRWTIEVFFQALKGRGFKLESSRLRCLEKYRKLFAIVTMAYTICWATAIQDARTKPVKVKNHGYPQYSVFRRGLNILRAFFQKQYCPQVEITLDSAWSRAGPIFKTVG